MKFTRARSHQILGLGRIAGCLLILATAAAARAEHARIQLLLIGPHSQQEAFADHEPPVGGTNPRPRFKAKAGEQLVLQFVLTNTYPHKQLDNVTVRYYVVRTTGIGVKPLPDLKREQIVTQGTVDMNFKPSARVGARLRFRIDEPGFYLVRVDTLNTDSDHEHFSAIDLEVN